MLTLFSASLMALVLIVYSPTWKYHFIIDDMSVWLESKKQPIPPRGFWLFFKQLRGDGLWNPALAHLATTLIHALVCVLIYLALGHNSTSYAAAFLFAINPANNQASIWISGRLYALSTAFVLSGFLPNLAYFSPLLQASAIHFCSINGLFSGLIYLWSRDFKVIALMVPLLFLWKYKVIFNKAPGSKLAGFITNQPAMSLKPYKIIVALKFYGYYLTSTLLGINTHFYHRYMANFTTTSRGVAESKCLDRYFFIGSIGAMITMSSLILGLVAPYNVYWGLLWFSLNIAMWTQVITFSQHIAMRYIYLANVGLMLAIAGLCLKSAIPWFIFVIAIWYYAQLRHLLPSYQSEFWHTEYIIMQEPKYSYTWLLHGNMNLVRNHFTASLMDYLEAERWDPTNFKVHYNLSAAYLCLRQSGEAWAEVMKCRQLECFGQEKEKEFLIKEREELFTRIEKAWRQHQKLHLRVPEDIGFLV